jgi:hypothetical protein
MRLRHNATKGTGLPELPEVETVRRGLQPHLEGSRIARAEARRPDLRWPLPPDLVQVLTGARVITLRRRAKYLLADLDRGTTLLLHLGMSGRMLVEGASQGDFHRDPAILPRHDYIPSLGSPAWLTQEQIMGTQAPAMFHRLKVLGSYGPLFVIQSDFCPEDYLACFATSGPNSADNAIGIV